MSFWTILLIIGLAQGLYLIAGLLVFNRVNALSNKYLCFLIFSACAHIAFELINTLQNEQFRLVLRIISISSPLLIGPSLYLFFKQTLKRTTSSIPKALYHFVPFIILTLFLGVMEFFSEAISSNPTNENLPFYVSIIEFLKVIHLGVYILLSYKLINQLTKSSNPITYKNNTKQILLWFRVLLVLIIAAVLLSLVYFVAIKYLGVEAPVGNPRFIALILIILIYSIAFMGVRFPIMVSSESNTLIIKRTPKYKTSSLSQGDIDSKKQTLIRYMAQEQPFLDSDLKIEGLGKALNIPTHHLSQIINQEFEKSFQDFINQYRVEAFKTRIIDPKNSNKTILAIALDSGFSSKSSFNRIFKTHTGITPNAFKALNMTNESQIRK